MREFWLFRKSDAGFPRDRKRAFWLWNGGILFCAGLCLGGLSLFFAYGDYTDLLMKSYFTVPLIPVLNLVPVVLLVFLLWFLLGRAWLAFFLSSLVVWGLSLGNYYLLRFRDDPLMFEDVRNVATAMAFTGDYDMTPDLRIWFGLCCILLGTVLLFLFVRGVPKGKTRAALFLLGAALCVPLRFACTDDDLYNGKTRNFTYINRWSSTQVYISKGFVYPFLHSITEGGIKPPKGYDEQETAALLAACEDQDIPADQKVDIITLQLEAFADFSRFEGVEGIDWERAYGVYHGIEAESYTGNLVTNIFAGGTIDTERAFLTGYADQWNYRTNTNSYAWYLADQGYTVTGSHPSNDWFYNRKNVNGYLGLSDYYFCENRYTDLYADGMAPDEILLPDIFDLYVENRYGSGAPWFSFNVTYQGHGPYSTTDVWRGNHYTDGRYSTETTNIVDNYLGSVSNTAEQLRTMLDAFAAEDRPVVVVGFGDHMPWLGDGNSAYHELGVEFDTSEKEGFYNYYATRYFIWANDAAKRVLDSDFTGEGPDVSSCFLMNLLFEQCGWQGNAFMQATEAVRQELPVLTSLGRYVSRDGTLVETPGGAGQTALETYRALEYYDGTHFKY